MYTKTGRLCQPWDVDSPHTRDSIIIGEFILKSPLKDIRNYCRNYDLGGDTIWCYTMDTKKRWDYCNPLTSASKETAGVMYEDELNIGKGLCQTIETCAAKCLDSQRCTAFDFNTDG